MTNAIVVPQVGQDLTEGKVLAINVKVGDQVKKGDIVATVESEKAAFEVEAFVEGTVLEICYSEGDWGTVLEPLMILGEPGESLAAAAPSAASKSELSAAPSVHVVEVASSAVSGKFRSSPLARKLAELEGVNLTSITGTGPRQAVVKRDVLAALNGTNQQSVLAAVARVGTEVTPIAASANTRPALMSVPVPQAQGEDVEIPHTRMRQIIADKLLASKQNVPHFYLQAEVDVTDVLAARKVFNESAGIKITVNDILVRSAALTLMEHRAMNAHVSENSVIRKGEINIGIAVSVDDGLMVPVIAGADRLDTLTISTETRKLADAARRGLSKSTAVGTFSISNLGMYGVTVFPIINPPEAAILGIGPTKSAVRPFRGGIHLREIMTLNLSADHRAVDGALAAAFLKRLVEVIETFRIDT